MKFEKPNSPHILGCFGPVTPEQHFHSMHYMDDS